MRDPRNTAQVQVACCNNNELQIVKQVAEKALSGGVRVLRDQLFPVKIDNANCLAVLDEHNQLHPGIAENLGKENNIHIAKIAWLSKKDSAKAYGSMVIYVTKASDASQLLQEQFFHVAGESAYTSTFISHIGPTQCYRCQAVGHKAFNCKNPQVCGRCAKEGHHHRDCIDAIPKCVLCGGPHESYSKNCRVLYPRAHE